VITIVIFAVLVLTAIILGVIGDDGVSAIQLLTAGGILLVMALSSLWMLRKVGARYDQGFKITYKD
jgi:ABC-2 type transport system permease protein